jgi:hypothetical protein
MSFGFFRQLTRGQISVEFIIFFSVSLLLFGVLFYSYSNYSLKQSAFISYVDSYIVSRSLVDDMMTVRLLGDSVVIQSYLENNSVILDSSGVFANNSALSVVYVGTCIESNSFRSFSAEVRLNASSCIRVS